MGNRSRRRRGTERSGRDERDLTDDERTERLSELLGGTSSAYTIEGVTERLGRFASGASDGED